MWKCGCPLITGWASLGFHHCSSVCDNSTVLWRNFGQVVVVIQPHRCVFQTAFLRSCFRIQVSTLTWPLQSLHFIQVSQRWTCWCSRSHYHHRILPLKRWPFSEMLCYFCGWCNGLPKSQTFVSRQSIFFPPKILGRCFLAKLRRASMFLFFSSGFCCGTLPGRPCMPDSFLWWNRQHWPLLRQSESCRPL